MKRAVVVVANAVVVLMVTCSWSRQALAQPEGSQAAMPVSREDSLPQRKGKSLLSFVERSRLLHPRRGETRAENTGEPSGNKGLPGSPFMNFQADEELDRLKQAMSDLFDKGDYSRALPVARQTCDLARGEFGENHREYAKALNNLAWMLQSMGQYREARLLFEKSLSIHEQGAQPLDSDLATVLNNLASLLAWQGDYQQAVPLFQRSVRIQERILGPNHTDVGKTLNNLAVAMESSGRGREALALYERALSIEEQRKDRDAAIVATTLNNMAVLHDSFGDADRALSMLKRSLELRTSVLGRSHPDVAESLINLATMESRVSPGEKPRQLALEAVAIYRKSLGAKHPDLATALNCLGKVELACGDRQAGVDHILEAADILDSHLQETLPYLSFAEQRSFLSSRLSEETSLLLSYCRSGDALRRGYNRLFRWKGFLIESLRWQSMMQQLFTRGNAASTAGALLKARRDLAEWYHRSNSVAYENWKARNDELTAVKECYERAMAQSGIDKCDDVLAGSSFKDFAALLHADECLVDIYKYCKLESPNSKGEWRYGAYLMNSRSDLSLVDLGSVSAVDRSLADWRGEVTSGGLGIETWRRLETSLWRPLSAEKIVAQSRKVFVSCDSELTRLPWQLLPAPVERKSQVMLSQLDSPRELAYLRKSPLRHGQPELFLIAGGLNFGRDSRAGDGAGGRVEFPYLPGTRREAREIAELAGGLEFNTVALFDHDATKMKVLELLPKSAYVHLATHGFFSQETRVAASRQTRSGVAPALEAGLRNPLVESGIALSSPPDNPDGRCDRLTAEDLVGVDLAACKSVTLSACETGLGEKETGQGVLGLRASMMAAGCRSVLVSLWKVPDESTIRLMREFYRNVLVRRMSRGEALRQAQSTLYKQPYDAFKKPYHWGAWVLVGESW